MSCTRLAGNCNLYKTCLSPCTKGRGNTKAEIMLIGEANGENEDKQATPFVGLSGSFLSRHILRGTGLDESDLFITNAVKCRPQQNKKPNINNVRACRPYLDEEIKKVQPKVILLLGNVALHSLVNIYHSKPGQDEKKSSGLSGISQWRGIPLWSKEFTCWLVPTYHPSALLHDRQEGIEYRIDQVISDFELAAKLVGDKKEKKYPKSYICTSTEKAKLFLDKLLALPKVAFDIESEDLDPTISDLLGISFSDSPDRGVYIPKELIEKDKDVKNKIFKLMTSTKVLKILHNGAFDIGYLRYKKYPRMVNWRDTMQEASLIDENFTKGLKPLVWRYLTFGGYDKELDQYRVENKLKTYKGIPQAILGKYAGFDTAATFQLDDLFYPRLQQEGLLPLFDKILMPVRQVMCDAEHNGFAVDKERAQELNLLCDKAVDKLKVRAYEIVGEEFNLRSPPQLSKILYQKMKLKPLKKSKKSESFSCDKASLEYCASQKRGEIAQTIIDIKYIQSQQSKFINLILKHAREDGRVHTHYNLTGTVTGRTSCSNPGIHNIPRDRLIRSMFKASTGRVLVEADVKSAELRCLAVYSKEKFLISAFNEGRDLHTETYNIMYNKPKTYKPTDDERFISKCVASGSYVWTERGLAVIDSLVGNKNGFHKCSLPVLSDVGLLEAKKSYRAENCDVVDIETQLGFTVSPTRNDTIRVFEQDKYIWKKIKEVRIGDHLVLKVGANIFGNTKVIPWERAHEKKVKDYKELIISKTLTKDWAAFLGWYVSEGSVCSGSVSISQKEGYANSHIASLVYRLFGERAKTFKSKKIQTWHISSIDLINHLSKYCSRGSANVFIPSYILSASKEIQISFLQTLFEGDGWITKNGVGITSKSRELIKQVQLLLLNFGIVAAVEKETKKEYGDFWSLRLRNKIYVSVFANLINFPSYSIKRTKLISWVEKKKYTKGLLTIPITQSYISFLRKNNKYSDYLREVDVGQSRLTEQRLQRLQQQGIYLGDELDFMLANDLYCVPIKSISQPRVATVYDFYEPTRETLVVNGVVCHDSINFGLIYGRGVKSLATLLKVSEEEAQRLIDLYFEKMPNVKKFLLQNIKDAHKNKYIKSVFGRKRRLPLISSDDFMISSKCERQANNSIIQSTAADYTYVILGRVAKSIEQQGLDSKIILTVHDSIVIDSPVYEAEKIKSIIVSAYEAPVNVLPIKMEMDVEIEARWGEKKGSLLEEVLIKAGVIKATPKKVEMEIDEMDEEEIDAE
jgi:uracil-DNA glycosylase family 4